MTIVQSLGDVGIATTDLGEWADFASGFLVEYGWGGRAIDPGPRWTGMA